MKTKSRRRKISSNTKPKRRINVAFTAKIFKIVDSLASKEDTSLSNMAHELIEEALEMREDIYFSKLSDQRLEESEGKPGIPAEEVWKRLGLE